MPESTRRWQHILSFAWKSQGHMLRVSDVIVRVYMICQRWKVDTIADNFQARINPRCQLRAQSTIDGVSVLIVQSSPILFIGTWQFINNFYRCFAYFIDAVSFDSFCESRFSDFFLRNGESTGSTSSQKRFIE